MSEEGRVVCMCTRLGYVCNLSMRRAVYPRLQDMLYDLCTFAFTMPFAQYSIFKTRNSVHFHKFSPPY